MAPKNPIAIIVSQFNQEVTDLLLAGATQRLKERGVPMSLTPIYYVPGAVEIPVLASKLASSRKFDGIICLGAVIRGETSHFDYVCMQVSYGCQKVAIEYTIPVIFGILTTDNEAQALDRCGGIHGHKGIECADVALDMIALMEQIP